ncbi:MAG: hypothetical protein HYY52_02850 [Candidatus Melainabacteria bacterium]|nr:hypothetical protein [Candidatus Melainabacteria bacterium]
MISRIIILQIFVFMFLSGCTKNPDFQSSFSIKTPCQKINNLLDINKDGKSDFIFWNTSSMSGFNKFLEPCFFETITSSDIKHSKFNLGTVGDIPFVGYFDGDSILDFGVYRTNLKGEGEWHIKNGNNPNANVTKLGQYKDIPLPSDYDGDGKFDLIFYRTRDNTFQGILSSNNLFIKVKLGMGQNIPVPKDYDGDGQADFAVYSSKDGFWNIKSSRDGTLARKKLGGKNFLPIPADYDQDGKADVCVWEHTNNKVLLLFSSSGELLSDKTIEVIQKELSLKDDYFPVSSDYDGDGASELAFWSSSSKRLLTFNLLHNSVRKNIYYYPQIANSFPVNNFLLMKLLYNNNSISSPLINFNYRPVLAYYDHGNIIYCKFEKLLKAQRLYKNDCREKKLLKLNQMDNYIPFVFDTDGDYVLDNCLWSINTGVFLCDSSRLGYKFAIQVGNKNDKPVVGNFNNDSIQDLGAYRASNQTFYIRYLGISSPENIQIIMLTPIAGNNGIPQINDYDGDGIDDFCVFNPDKVLYVIVKSSNLKEIEVALQENKSHNAVFITPLSSDFDGDMQVDPAILDPYNNEFIYSSSSDGKIYPYHFRNGINGYSFTADIDGDLKSDIVFLDTASGTINAGFSSKNWKLAKLASDNLFVSKSIKLVNCPGFYYSINK